MGFWAILPAPRHVWTKWNLTTFNYLVEKNHIPFTQVFILSSYGNIYTRLLVLILVSSTRLVAKGQIVPQFRLKIQNFGDLYHVADVGFTIKCSWFSQLTCLKIIICTIGKKLQKYVGVTCPQLTFLRCQLPMGFCAILPGRYKLNHNFYLAGWNKSH